MTKNEELIELLRHLDNGLFADRDNIKEAFDYAYKLIETLSSSHKICAYTALHVVVNTIAKEAITRLKTNG